MECGDAPRAKRNVSSRELAREYLHVSSQGVPDQRCGQIAEERQEMFPRHPSI